MTVGALYLGREFLIPLAVAGLLTFVLNPIVRVFERRLPRAAAVVLVVILTFSVLGAFTWALALQAASLGGEIPSYRDNLKEKIAEVRGASRGGVIEKVQSATKEVVEEFQKEDKPVKPAEKPVPVVVKSQPSAFWQLPVVLSALGNVGLVLVLVIFMLLERLQLRDRLIRLIGFGRIATTTKAMDEAAQRITHYLTMQTLINGTYGLGVALGALLIGLPYAFLWGSLAAVLRFIPYVGPWAAALIVSSRRSRGVRRLAPAGPDRGAVHRARALHQPRPGDVSLQPERRRVPGGAPGGGRLLDLGLGTGRARAGDAA